MTPQWTMLSTDRNGKVTERVWVLPRLGPWAGHAVFDGGHHTGRGRYQLCFRVDGDTGVQRSTGIHFHTQREMLAWMAENPSKEM